MNKQMPKIIKAEILNDKMEPCASGCDAKIEIKKGKREYTIWIYARSESLDVQVDNGEGSGCPHEMSVTWEEVDEG